MHLSQIMEKLTIACGKFLNMPKAADLNNFRKMHKVHPPLHTLLSLKEQTQRVGKSKILTDLNEEKLEKHETRPRHYL